MTAMADPAVTAEWLRPVGHTSSGEASWTRLGTLDGTGEPLVDSCGVVQVAPGRPGIAWWIAGDDRWYFPSREATVRQSLLHGAPVVETRMRIKGGDVCQRAYAMTVSGASGLREIVVIEVENTTGVPCGVAFAVRPFGLVDAAPVHRVDLDGGVLRADGDPVLVLPSTPGGALAGNYRDGDLTDRVARGEATGSGFAPLECSEGFAQAVVVVPIAHRTSVRVVLPVPDESGGFAADAAEVPGAVAPAESVARGWRAQVRDTARVSVPDPRLQSILDSSAAWLLATTSAPRSAIGRSIWDPRSTPRWDHVAATAGALDRLGLQQRSAGLLAQATADCDEHSSVDPTWLIEAYATHLERDADDTFARAVVDSCAQILASLQSRSVPAIGVRRQQRIYTAARLVFERAGEARAARLAARAADAAAAAAFDVVVGVEAAADSEKGADRCGEVLAAVARLWDGDARDAWAVLDRRLDDVSSTGVWAAGPEADPDRHSVGVGAAVASLACDLLVHVRSRGLHLATYVPPTWLGVSFEAHDIVTAFARAGFAVRWHGHRPALLWDAGGDAQTDQGGVTVDAKGLDPSWQASVLRGEALLAEVDMADAPPKTGARVTGLNIGSAPDRSESL